MKRHLLAASAFLALSGCGTSDYFEVSFFGGDRKPPPTVATPAAPLPAPEPEIRIVAVPEPLPLPGQLKPAPLPRAATPAPRPLDVRPQKRPEKSAPQQTVEAINAGARVAPATQDAINAIQVFPFAEGALYQVFAKPNAITDIVLQAGEVVENVAAGDTTRWIIGRSKSGAGPRARQHVLLKPTRDDLQTNLTILTDRRVYYLEVTAQPHTFMASVSWRYPQEELFALERATETAADQEKPIVDQGIALDALNFGYTIEGDAPAWRPVRAFDDGRKVFIEFPPSLETIDAPPLFLIGAAGDTQLVNYRLKGRHYIVDRLFNVAELRLGTDPQQVVRISRDASR